MLSANNSYFNSLFRMHVWILYRESVFGGVGWGWGEEGGNVLFCTVGRISWFLSSRLLKKGNMNFDHLFMKTGKSCASCTHRVSKIRHHPPSWNNVLDPMQFRENCIFQSKKGKVFREHAAYTHPNFRQAIPEGEINQESMRLN